MTKASFTAWDVDDIDTIYDVSYEPVSTCPTCCFPLEPSILDVYHVAQNPVPLSEQSLHHVYVLSFCPRCRSLFMCKYTATAHVEQADLLECITLDEHIHPSQTALSFSDTIQNISVDFPMTYAQSEEAETHQLDHIAALGYQRSLELLLKDYLTLQFPEDSGSIKTESLGASMRRLSDKRFHALADILEETPQPINTSRLKSILQATLRYIESEAALDASLLMPL